MSRLLSNGKSAGVVEPTLAPLRDLIISMAPPPSLAFDLRLDPGENWMEHPALEAEANKRGCTVPDLALQLSVVMVDQFGGFVKSEDVEAKARFIQVSLNHVEVKPRNEHIA